MKVRASFLEEGWIDGWISVSLRLDGWISVSLRKYLW